MKTAREMFEELGFILMYDYETSLCYMHDDVDLYFDKLLKEVEVNDWINDMPILKIEVIRAIYKQCKELGWLEDE